MTAAGFEACFFIIYKKQGYVVYKPEGIRLLYDRGLIDDKMLRWCGGIEGVTEYEHSDRKPLKQKKKETDEQFAERLRLDEIDREFVSAINQIHLEKRNIHEAMDGLYYFFPFKRDFLSPPAWL